MPCKIPAVVEEYLQMVEADTPRACPEQHALAELVRRAFSTETLCVDEDRLQAYLGLEKYFPFDLFPWEKFLLALWFCTYSAPGRPRWRRLLCVVSRGAGKDGFIAYTAFMAISPYNPVPKYNVDICANDEEQATRPVKDIVDVLETDKYIQKLNRHYYHTKEIAQGRKNRGSVKGRANSPRSRDGLRPGLIIFNEAHAYENYDNIRVYRSALGKTDEPREGVFTSYGHIIDGPLDDMLERAKQILMDGQPDNGLLPFICRVPNEEMIHDPENWHMANPSLQYLPALYQETMDEYQDWRTNPAEHADFAAKRMGVRKRYQELSVTEYENLLATKQPLPDLTGWDCTIGLDYAEINDWASVNAHFRMGNMRYDINHTWVCLQSKTIHRVKAPYRDWANAGLVTLVDDVSINPELLAEYIAALGRTYNVKKIAMDNFRWTLVSEAMRKIGFDARDKNRVKLVRPSDIMQIDPVVQECFDRGYFAWGDNPCLRWAVNNTKRIRSGKKDGTDTGNYYYGKIEGKSRKTDPFMALAASMTIETALNPSAPVASPPMGAIAF